ncbi:MAG: hypothetical protein ACRDIB_19170, partial [Ardenticatenaceae bacterium]
ACDEAGEENVDITCFRYPGPTPQTREAAILMLADTVEATARAVKPAGEQEIDALSRKVIATKLGEGQLDDCELNLRDMERIRHAFVEVLQGIYHPRISYPGQEKSAALPGASSPDGHPQGVPLLTDAGRATPEGEHERADRPSPERSAVGTTG